MGTLMAGNRIVLAGGGTGGHIYPALAVAERLREFEEVEELLYIGALGHAEAVLSREHGLQFVGLRVSGLPRNLSPAIIAWPFQFLAAVAEARKVLHLFRASAVMGTGGYASAPPLVAAKLSGIPYIIHEPDAHPGMVNRCLAHGASLVSLGMEGAAHRLKPGHARLVVNGNPVRKSFGTARNRDAACAVLGLDPKLKTILVTGGSQGARPLNQALTKILPELLMVEPFLQVIHQAGERNLDEMKTGLDASVLSNPRYCLRTYFEDLSLPYGACDLSVCRAGAMTIAELASTGTPAIFIPYPHAAANHQAHNARFMASLGAALVIDEKELTAGVLKNEILSLVNDDARLQAMRKSMRSAGKPTAALDLAKQVLGISADYLLQKKRQ